MERKIYAEENGIALAEYVFELDEKDIYDCWRDEATESGYNNHAAPTFEEHLKRPIRSTKIMIMKDGKTVGCLLLSPPECDPDLAIMIYPKYRYQGIGTAAFALGLKYCFEKHGFDFILAGCMEGNEVSRKMLRACGMIPHPEGNVLEKHYITGEDRIQYDFIKYRGKEESDAWNALLSAAKKVQNKRDVSPFIEAGGVAAAILTDKDNIYVGVCIDTSCTLGMCAERNAIANMITNGESKIKKIVAVMSNGALGMPCGACREFLMQLDRDSGDIEILKDSETYEAVKLRSLVPEWWGYERFNDENSNV